MSKDMNLQRLFYVILFCISVAALVIACLAFAKKDCGKGEHYDNKSKQLKYKYTGQGSAPLPMPGTVYRSSTNSCTKKDASDCPSNPDPNASSIPGTKICEDGICKYPVKITGCGDGPPRIAAGLGYEADKWGNFPSCFNTPGANWGVVHADKGGDTSMFGLDLYPWKKTGSACTKGDLVSGTCVNTCNLTQGKGVISSSHNTEPGYGAQYSCKTHDYNFEGDNNCESQTTKDCNMQVVCSGQNMKQCDCANPPKYKNPNSCPW